MSAKRKSIMVVGDSIAAHYTPFLARYLSPEFQILPQKGVEDAAINWDIPRGANGGESSRLLASLREAFQNPSLRPALSLVNCGLHDIKRARETQEIVVCLDEYLSNLEAIVGEFRSRDLTMVWVRTTGVIDEIHNTGEKPFLRFAADASEYDAAAVGVMGSLDVAMIDLAAVSEQYCGEVFIDHVHFIESIRQRQAAFLSGWIHAFFVNQAEF